MHLAMLLSRGSTSWKRLIWLQETKSSGIRRPSRRTEIQKPKVVALNVLLNLLPTSHRRRDLIDKGRDHGKEASHSTFWVRLPRPRFDWHLKPDRVSQEMSG